MTLEQVSQTLRIMEQLRMDSMGADTKREERKLVAEYGRLWKSIEPFVTGTEPYTQGQRGT